MENIAQNTEPSPLNIGEQIELKIEDVAFGGEGVGKLAGFVVFVPFVIKDEVVRVEITEVKKAFARGKLIEILKPSINRVKPRCEYFGTCGGCQYQHIEYSEQQQIKETQVRDLFERIG